jgi:hypothetical protein
MRRTFQDLMRAANVKDIVTRRISGHATEAMQLGYSTVEQGEILDALTRVNELVGFDRLDGDASQGGADALERQLRPRWLDRKTYAESVVICGRCRD